MLTENLYEILLWKKSNKKFEKIKNSLLEWIVFLVSDKKTQLRIAFDDLRH